MPSKPERMIGVQGRLGDPGGIGVALEAHELGAGVGRSSGRTSRELISGIVRIAK